VKEVENRPRVGGGIKKPGKFADGSNKNRQKLQAIISILFFKITLCLALLAKRMLTMEKIWRRSAIGANSGVGFLCPSRLQTSHPFHNRV